uniref:CWH43-like N-terminal domain-containing protein n=1 Tax=Xenopus tropicalis TaxID=8364 RepID=A0A1B8Y031_XENTR
MANIAFTVMHVFCSFIGAATMYARYTLLRHCSAESVKKRTWANIILLVLGLLACQAYFLENNFPVLVFQKVHIAGVLTATVCASVYTVINTVISYRTPPEKDSRVKCHLHLVISLATILALALDHQYGTSYHKWLSTIIFYGYLATFATDFKIYGFTIPKNMEDDWFYIITSSPGDVEANTGNNESSEI